MAAAVHDNSPTVRVAAACALAGLCDALRRRSGDLEPADALPSSLLLDLLAGDAR